MCEPTTMAMVAMGATAAQGIIGAQQANAQGKYQQAVANQNARAQERQASDARARGVIAGEEQRDRARMIGSRQATGLAASGLDISSGSSLDLFAETATLGEYDAQVAENNAAREAYGYQTRASESRASGRNARQAGRNQAFSTLLTSGARSANIYSQNFGS